MSMIRPGVDIRAALDERYPSITSRPETKKLVGRVSISESVLLASKNPTEVIAREVQKCFERMLIDIAKCARITESASLGMTKEFNIELCLVPYESGLSDMMKGLCAPRSEFARDVEAERYEVTRRYEMMRKTMSESRLSAFSGLGDYATPDYATADPPKPKLSVMAEELEKLAGAET